MNFNRMSVTVPKLKTCIETVWPKSQTKKPPAHLAHLCTDIQCAPQHLTAYALSIIHKRGLCTRRGGVRHTRADDDFIMLSACVCQCCKCHHRHRISPFSSTKCVCDVCSLRCCSVRSSVETIRSGPADIPQAFARGSVTQRCIPRVI